MEPFKSLLATAISDAFKALLSEKHLYQSMEVDASFIAKVAAKIAQEAQDRPPWQRRSTPSRNEMVAQAHALLAQPWVPTQILAVDISDAIAPSPSELQGQQSVVFVLPTVNTFCDTCNDRWPCNPSPDTTHSMPANGTSQWYHIGYQCQQCKGPAIRFLVRRNGIKLCLCGRDPLEVLPVPKILPRGPSKYYSNAVIAHNAGQTLAGLFLLRVFIEQFWKTIPTVSSLLKNDPRATGEKQGEAYQDPLPNDFKDRFPSLKEIYGKLSAAIHEIQTGEANAILFEETCTRIVEHFEARKLFKIV